MAPAQVTQRWFKTMSMEVALPVQSKAASSNFGARMLSLRFRLHPYPLFWAYPKPKVDLAVYILIMKYCDRDATLGT